MKSNTDRVFGFPDIIRFSWAPVKSLLKDHPESVATVEWSDEEDEDENSKATRNNAKVTDFFQSNVTSVDGKIEVGRGAKRFRRHAPFKGLSLVEDF